MKIKPDLTELQRDEDKQLLSKIDRLNNANPTDEFGPFYWKPAGRPGFLRKVKVEARPEPVRHGGVGGGGQTGRPQRVRNPIPGRRQRRETPQKEQEVPQPGGGGRTERRIVTLLTLNARSVVNKIDL